MLGTLLLGPLLGSAGAQMQQQFIAPPLLRDPLYDIKWQHSPIDVGQYPSDRVISIFDGIKHAQCVLPQEQDRGRSVTYLEPISNPDIIAEARDALSNLENTGFINAEEDVWAWVVSFNSSIFQVLPNRGEDPRTGKLLVQDFYVSVGEQGSADGTNLHTATPAVVNDKHMMMVAFTAGSLCDLTKAPRTTRLFFTCDTEAVETPVLQSAHEPYPCLYELVIGTNELCSIPEFRYPQVEPNYIVCGPDPEYPDEANLGEEEEEELQKQSLKAKEEEYSPDEL